jgi:Domain of unknown function (DUF4383)
VGADHPSPSAHKSASGHWGSPASSHRLTFLYGLFAAGNSDINFLSLNGADNGLHLVSAAAGLAIALWPANRTALAGRADRRT